MKVVIIDDEVDICFILKFKLSTHGIDAVTFPSAIEAQAYLEHEKVQAVVCDFQMPQMNGLELYEWMRNKKNSTPFIILTGEPMVEENELLELGVTEVLYKPQDIKKLVPILNKICSQTN